MSDSSPPEPVVTGEIFLSYHSPDRASVLQVRQLLAARGVPTFFDREHLAVGMPWPQALEEGIGRAAAVAIFLGPHGVGLWQKREIGFALERQVRAEQAGLSFPVIPVLLAGTDTSPGFLFLNTWIDLRRDVGDAEMIDALVRAIRGDSGQASDEPKLTLCPYRGVRPFREEDSALYFGREDIQQQLLEAVRSRNFVAVVGPSGSGKSSMVQAGLVPKLRMQHPPSATWDVVSLVAGERPFHQLSAALIAMLEPDFSETDRLAEAQKLGDRLAAGEVPLDGVINRIIEKSRGTDRLLIVVDQFEEIYNQCTEVVQCAFATTLLAALGRAPVTLLITLRASFYDHAITTSKELGERLATCSIHLGPLKREDLHRAILEPARRVALRFEQGLAERILDDINNEPGYLPLLEFSVTELWARRQDRLLTHTAYEALGKVDGAAVRHAEEFHNGIGPNQQLLMRRVFTRLWAPGGGDGTRNIRQRAFVNDLGPGYWAIIKALADARVVVTDRDAKTGDATVDVAHDALVRDWPRFINWLEEDKAFLYWRHKLDTEIADWEGSHREETGLLGGRSLEEARRWSGVRADELTALEIEFINQSTLKRERDLVERVRSQRRLLLAATTSAAIFLIVAAVAWVQWRIADQQRKVLTSKQAAYSAVAQLPIDPELSMLLATAGLEVSDTAEAEDALRRAVLESHLRVLVRLPNVGTAAVMNHDGKLLATTSVDQTVRVWDAATGKKLFELPDQIKAQFSPSGNRIITVGKDDVARVWDAMTGKSVLELRGHTGGLSSAVWSADGKLIVTASRDGSARVWDAQTGAAVGTPFIHGGIVNIAAISPDNKFVATGGLDKTVKLWDVASGKMIAELKDLNGAVYKVAFNADGKRLVIVADNSPALLWQPVAKKSLPLSGHTGIAGDVAFSPDGKLLATASGDDAQLWNVDNGKLLAELRRHTDSVVSVAFSPDGRSLVTGGYDGLSIVWDVSRAVPVVELRGHTDGVTAASFSGDGKQVITAGRDRTARIWDAASRADANALIGHGSAVVSAAFSPDGKELVTGSADNTARIWDVKSRHTSEQLTGHTGAIAAAQFSPDGKLTLTASRDGTARIWDSASGKLVTELKGHSGAIRKAAFSPDGKRVATASNDTSARLWDASSGQLLREFNGHADRIYGLAFSPDGKLLATGSADNTARVWSTASDSAPIELQHQDGVRELAFSPDNTILATGTRDGSVQLWDATSGKPLAKLQGHSARIVAVSFNRDGTLLLTGSWDGTARLWEVPSGKQLRVLDRHTAQLSSAEFSPDGKLIVTGSWDSSARLWETATGKSLRDLRGHSDRVLDATFSPDGTQVATASRDGTARIWSVPTGGKDAIDADACDACGPLEDVIALAKKRVTRRLTPQELQQYLNEQRYK